jgi:hypothetical protein
MVPCLPKLSIDLPDQIAGLTYNHTLDLETPLNSDPSGTGVSLIYLKDVKRCDIHEYNLGLQDIGSGIASSAVQREFQRSINEIAQTSLKVIPAGPPEVLTIPGKSPLDWHCSGCWLSKPENPAYLQQERWFESYVCLTAWNGIFIKINLSQYLGQAVGATIREHADHLDEVQPAFLKELMLPFVTTVSELLTGTQTRDSIQQQLVAEQKLRDAQIAEEKRESDRLLQEQIQAGKRCPNCGLQFAWNGWACDHCLFQLPEN